MKRDSTHGLVIMSRRGGGWRESRWRFFETDIKATGISINPSNAGHPYVYVTRPPFDQILNLQCQNG